MVITLSTGTDDLLFELDAIGLEYEKRVPPMGTIMAAAGDILDVAKASVPYAALAGVFVAWLRARSSRVITILSEENKAIYTKGYSVDDFEQVLKIAKRIDAFDTNKPKGKAKKK